jgi:hypothetical protein
MSKKDIKIHHLSEGGGEMRTAFLPNSGSIVKISSELNENAGTEPVKVQYNDDNGDNETSLEYYRWGKDNCWPTTARMKLEDSTTAYPLIYKYVSIIYGIGLVYYREKREGEKIKKEFFHDAEIDEFFEQNDMDVFMLEQMMDFKFNGNIFGEFILSKDKKKIVNVYHKEGEFSRLKKMSEKDKYIKSIYYSGAWSDKDKEVNLDDTEEIPLINRRDRSKESIQSIAKKFKAAYHFSFPSPGRAQYGMPPHGGLFRKDGWLDYANNIPVIMNAINRNQITLKYHIKIPLSYWKSMYKDWDNLGREKQNELITEKLQDMDKWLTGTKNQGKGFVSHYATDPVTNKEVAGWEIIELDDKLKHDAYIPSSDAADIQIARAIGIDPSIAGIQPQGGKLGAGSGSDKRVGFNNQVILTHAEQRILFQPLYTIARFNEWDSNIKFAFAHEMSTKLDENPTGTQKQV